MSLLCRADIPGEGDLVLFITLEDVTHTLSILQHMDESRDLKHDF